MVEQDLKRERVRLTLEAWGRTGEALACHDGRDILVFGGIPGEEVVAEVIRCRREYLAARVVEVLRPSPHRVGAPCPYFGPCTGCQWQHIDYQYQLEMKRQIVVDALGHVGGFEAPPVLATVASPEQYAYRNHARFTVGRRQGELGFVNRESRRFVPINKCLLMDDGINDALGQLQGRCAETTQLSVRYGVNTSDTLVQPALRTQAVPLPSGQKYYWDSVGGRKFRISASSFFQVNIAQTERMVELVKAGLQLSGTDLLVDAYAGVGVFAILLAPYARRVIAIEESSSAVQDALASAEGVDGIQFLLGKTELVLAQIEETPQGVILDPPRAGCHIKALEALVQLAPSRVVYVSCDPDTLARDLKILCQGPFRLEQVQPIDMFPQTHHVECIATLSYRNHVSNSVPDESRDRADKDEIILASGSPRRRELLSCLGLKFRVVPSLVPEHIEPRESPQELVARLALSKAQSVAQSLSAGLVIGADSVVVIDGRVLGKPSDATEATSMLRSLRGKEHEVVTGVAVVNAAEDRVCTANKVSIVGMREYSEREIEAYVASGEPMDKAGAYAVQDKVFQPVARLDGCYANVMGLPLCLLMDLLKDSGYEFVPDARIQAPEGCSQCPLTNLP